MSFNIKRNIVIVVCVHTPYIYIYTHFLYIYMECTYKNLETNSATESSTPSPEIWFDITNPLLHGFHNSWPKLAPKAKITSIPAIIHTLWFNLSPAVQAAWLWLNRHLRRVYLTLFRRAVFDCTNAGKRQRSACSHPTERPVEVVEIVIICRIDPFATAVGSHCGGAEIDTSSIASLLPHFPAWERRFLPPQGPLSLAPGDLNDLW